MIGVFGEERVKDLVVDELPFSDLPEEYSVVVNDDSATVTGVVRVDKVLGDFNLSAKIAAGDDAFVAFEALFSVDVDADYADGRFFALYNVDLKAIKFSSSDVPVVVG